MLVSFCDRFWRDLQYGVRNLTRTPGYVVVAVLSLAFGIVCATTFFALINAVVLRPMAHVDVPERLVMLYGLDFRRHYGFMSYPDVIDIREQTEALAGLEAVSTGRAVTISTTSDAERQEQAEQVSEGYFDMLGVKMAMGRGFSADDESVDWNVAVIGHRMWQRDYGGDPSIIGRTIRVDGRHHTIIGVAPQGLQALQAPVLINLWIPLRKAWRDHRGYHGLQPVGRSADGITIEQVRAQVELVAQRLAEEYPDNWVDFRGHADEVAVLGARAARLPPEHRNQVISIAAMISLVIGLVLMVACSNVANLMLTRAIRRRSEIAVRLALGAGRRLLVQQLLTESLLIAALAGGLGLLLTYWLTSSLTQSISALQSLPTPDLAIDLRVVLFNLGLTLLTALAFGLVPALRASQQDLMSAMKDEQTGQRSHRFGMRNLLVVAQVAGSLVLVVGSVLLLRSLQQVSTIDLGFNPERVALLSLDLSHRQYDAQTGRQLVNDLSERLQALPGVTGVALARTPMLGGILISRGFRPEGYQPGPGSPEHIMAAANVVSPGYFKLMAVPLLRGREFLPSDDSKAPRVAIVNQAFADRYWPGQDPLGKQVSDSRPMTVVGVVQDSRYFKVTNDPPPHLWQPHAQFYTSEVVLHVRTSGDPRPLLPMLREQVRALDSELPIVELNLQESLVGEASMVEKITSALLGTAGVVTLGLAMIGIYGIMAFAISQRRREVGIRIALGARPNAVVAMVIREGLMLSAVGLAVGLVGVLLMSPALAAVLYGVSPLDPLSFTGAICLLVLAAIAASLPAALRAARVNPIEALRTD
jgi:putative ABC transport system permease protein